MKLTRFLMLLPLGVLVCPAPVIAQSRVPESDNQSWNDLQITIPVARKVDFTTQITLRLGDNVTQTADQRWGGGFVFKLNKYLSFAPFYFHREARPPSGRHEFEDRITLGGAVRIPVGKFTISDRNWFERRWRNPQVDAWRYRNRVQLEHPFKIANAKFTWQVSDELFYDWSLHDWVRNRFSVGASHAFNKHFTLDFYFMRQNDGRARPGDINIIGTVWRFRL